MSFQSMLGQNLFVGSTIGEGFLTFSDGTIQKTAYTGTTTDGSSDLVVDNLTVNQFAIIGTESNAGNSSMTIYGPVSQVLADLGSTAYGNNNMLQNTAGVNNTSFGAVALSNNSSGSYNVACGSSALANNISGSGNTAIGNGALVSSTSSTNTCVGYNSGNQISNTGNNTCIGAYSNSTYSNSTALGYNSNCSADNQLMLGTSSDFVEIPGGLVLDSTLNVSGESTLTDAQINSTLNVSGSTVLDSTLNVSGQTTLNQTQINSTLNVSGSTVLENTQIGESQTVYGKINQQMLNGNIALGYSSLSSQSSTTSGYSNTAVGYQTLLQTTSGYANSSFGYDALISCNSGYANTAVGSGTLSYLTSGYDCVAVGAGAGNSISEGYANTCIGAGSNVTDGATNSTVIGAGVSTPYSNQILLGTSSNNTKIPGSLYVNGSCTFTSGISTGTQAITYLYYQGTASVAYAGSPLDSYASSSQNTNVVSICTLDQSFPNYIASGYVSTNYQYIWASFVSSYNGSTNQILVSFVNLGQAEDYFPSTITYFIWGQ